MKKLFLILLPIIVWCLAAGAILLKKMDMRIASAEYSTKELTPKFDPEAVRKIHIVWRDWRADLQCKNGKWTVVQRKHPADSERIQQMMDAFRKMVPLKQIDMNDPAVLERLRVLPAESLKDPKSIPGIRVTFEGSNQQVLYDVILGRGHFISEPNQLQASPRNVPDGRYLGKIEGKQISPFLTATVFEEVHPIPGAWIKSPFIGEPAKAVQLQFEINGKVDWMFLRENITSPFICRYPAKRIPDNRALVEMINVLRGHIVSDCCAKKEYRFKLNDGGQFTICSDGKTYTIRFLLRDKVPDEILALFSSEPDRLYRIPPRIYELLKTAPLLR